MLLADLVAASHAVAATRSRTAKVAALADCLRRMEAGERRTGIAWLSGALPEGRIGIGYAALRSIEVPAAAQASLTIRQAADGITELARTGGPGSGARRAAILERLLARATAAEQQFVRRLLVGELRQGALEGIMADALAAAAEVDAAEVRRAVMVSGSLTAAGEAALDGGVEALRGFRLTLFRPLLPMLAGTAPDVGAALQRTGAASVETKYDGARVQVHRSGAAVRVYTRNLREVSANLPHLVAAVAGLPLRAVILDGEVLALRADGRPLPFQVTMSRFGRGRTRTGARGPAADAGAGGGADRSREASRDRSNAPGAAATGAAQHAGGPEAGSATAPGTGNAEATDARRTGQSALRDRAPADMRPAAAAAGQGAGTDAARRRAEKPAPGAAARRAARAGPDAGEAPRAPAHGVDTHAGSAAEHPLQAFFFDCLHVDGEDLIDRPLSERLAALDRACPAALRVPRVTTSDPERAARHAGEVLAAGHEGVMVKALDSTYEAGRRGSGWIKVKPAHTLDLVVVAVEWGSGRRRGWLSNLHLAARDTEGGGFAMVGKTFKGMTDDMLRWQTERFLELETGRRGGVVCVRPEQVVEVAFDGIQRSSRYDSGMALRFARVRNYRADKSAAEADTMATMRALHHRAGEGGTAAGAGGGTAPGDRRPAPWRASRQAGCKPA